jgi:hypothetical protein
MCTTSGSSTQSALDYLEATESKDASPRRICANLLVAHRQGAVFIKEYSHDYGDERPHTGKNAWLFDEVNGVTFDQVVKFLITSCDETQQKENLTVEQIQAAITYKTSILIQLQKPIRGLQKVRLCAQYPINCFYVYWWLCVCVLLWIGRVQVCGTAKGLTGEG